MTETMSAHEVAVLLQCTEETVLEKAAAGKLAAVKYGRSWIFLRTALFEGLHLTALANLKIEPATPAKPKEVPAPIAYAVPAASRSTTRRTVRPTLPTLA